jgi:hypothetical protein
MRKISAIGLSTILAIGITGCGSTQNNSAEAQSLIKKGCKEFTQTVQKKSSDAAYVETFSKLAILNPAYLEVSRAAGIFKTLNIIQENAAGNQYQQMYVDSVGTLYGLCQSVK